MSDQWAVNGRSDGSILPEAHNPLDALVAAETSGWQAIRGETLLHGDMYPHNILITPHRAAYFVDWAHAWIGARWIDVIIMLLGSVEQSEIDPESVVRSLRQARAEGHHRP